MMQNNSTEMKTFVETFVIEETAELIYDDASLDKWNEYVKKLGLKGQETIVKPGKSPIPYLYINDNLKNTFDTLCPRHVDVEDYDATPIPLEILQHISLSVKEGYFQKIQIWYDDKDKDPLAIGLTGYITPISTGNKWHHEGKCKSSEEALKWLEDNGLEPYDGYKNTGGYLSIDKHYLIGRWADVKRSFKELTAMARERYISERKNEAEKQILEAQRKLEDLEVEANSRFNAASINNYPF